MRVDRRDLGASDWARFCITRSPWARVKFPVWVAMIFIPGYLAIASRKPAARSRATEAPGVPESSTMLALPPVAVASHSPARRPCSMKLEASSVT